MDTETITRRQRLAEMYDRTASDPELRELVLLEVVKETGFGDAAAAAAQIKPEALNSILDDWRTVREHVTFSPIVTVTLERGGVVAVDIDWSDSLDEDSEATDDALQAATTFIDEKINVTLWEVETEAGKRPVSVTLNPWLEGVMERILPVIPEGATRLVR